MRVRLVAALDLAVVRFIRGVDVRVLLAVRAVGEAAVAALVLALERFLPWNMQNIEVKIRIHTHKHNFFSALPS